MAQMIGLMIKVTLSRFLPKKFKTRILITPGTHVNELEINKQINDKERVAAAVENSSIGRILMRGYLNSDRYNFWNFHQTIKNEQGLTAYISEKSSRAKAV